MRCSFLLLVGTAAITGFAPSVGAQSITLDPSAGPHQEFTATSTGFGNATTQFSMVREDGVPMIFANCPPPPADPGNCTVTLQPPHCEPTLHRVRAFNNIGEQAFRNYVLYDEKFSIWPTCGPPGTQVKAKGEHYRPDWEARVVMRGVDGSASRTMVLGPTDAQGHSTLIFAVPDTPGDPLAAPGDHEIWGGDNICAGKEVVFRVTSDPPDPDECAPIALLVDFGGDVFVVDPTGATRPVVAGGTTLHTSDTVETASTGNSWVALTFDDETAVQLGDDTELRLAEWMDPGEPTRTKRFVGLVQGAMVWVSGEDRTDLDTDIEIPLGAVGLVGTEFIVIADGPAPIAQEIHLIDGQLALTPHATGTETIVDAPISVYWDIDGNITTAPLTQEDYDTIRAGLGLPSCTDTDGDGVCDADDNCPTVPNPDQGDNLGNGIGNACDPNCSLNSGGGYLCSPPGRDCSAAPMRESSAPLLLLFVLAALAVRRLRWS